MDAESEHLLSRFPALRIATSGKKRTAASVTSEGQANKLKRLAGHLKGIYLHGAGQSGLETLRTANIQQQANCERRHAKRAAAEEARQDTAKRVSAVADLMTESMAKVCVRGGRWWGLWERGWVCVCVWGGGGGGGGVPHRGGAGGPTVKIT